VRVILTEPDLGRDLVLSPGHYLETPLWVSESGRDPLTKGYYPSSRVDPLLTIVPSTVLNPDHVPCLGNLFRLLLRRYLTTAGLTGSLVSKLSSGQVTS